MNRINEFGIEPGVYKHYKGGLYVVTDIVTHMEPTDVANNELLQLAGKQPTMVAIADPLVIYRDVEPIKRHVNGKEMVAHQVYARKLSDFIGNGDTGKKRFTKE